MTASGEDRRDDVGPYARIAEWYDLEHDSFTDDLTFYLELLGGETRRLTILEVGSGSGRLVAALASAGYVVTGVEPSAAMRARHARRMAALPESVARRASVIAGSATALNLPADQRFDVAVLGLGVFNHLIRAEERAAALAALRPYLRPKARLIVDVDLLGPRQLLKSGGRLWRMGEWPTGERGASVEHLIGGAPGSEPGVVEVTHYYITHEPGTAPRRSVIHLPLALLSRGEVAAEIEHAGYELSRLYGDYDMTPARDISARAIAVAYHCPQQLRQAAGKDEPSAAPSA